MDLLTYLKNYEPLELVHFSRLFPNLTRRGIDSDKQQVILVYCRSGEPEQAAQKLADMGYVKDCKVRTPRGML